MNHPNSNAASKHPQLTQANPVTRHPRGAIPVVVIWAVCIIAVLFTGGLVLPSINPIITNLIKLIAILIAGTIFLLIFKRGLTKPFDSNSRRP